LQAVRPSIAIASVIGSRPITVSTSAQVNSQSAAQHCTVAGITEDRVTSHSVVVAAPLDNDAAAEVPVRTVEGNTIAGARERAADSVAGCADDVHPMPAIAERTNSIDLRPDKVALNHHSCDAAQINAVTVVTRYDIPRASRCASDRDTTDSRIVD
jgi:hypothetical protein